MHRLPRVLLSAAFAFTLSGLAQGGGLEGEAPLMRPPDAPDPDAKGEIEVEQEKDGEAEFELEAEGLDPGGAFEAFLEDAAGSGNLASIGLLELDDDEGEAEFKLRFESDEGGLPLGAQSIEELVGRRVEVRGAGDLVYLYGVVPALSDHKGKGGGWDVGKGYLTRAAGAVDDERGKVELRTRDSDGRTRFKVEAEHMPLDVFGLFLEDAVGSGTMVEVGALSADGDDDLISSSSEGEDEGDDDDEDDDDGSEHEYEVDTGHGDPLPLGAASAADLVGRRFEVRASGGAVVLEGVVPDPAAGSEKTVKAKDSLEDDDEDDDEGRLFLLSKPKKGEEDFRLTLKGLAADSVELFVEDPVSSVMTSVGVFDVKSNGKLKVRFRNKHGEPLPLGVASLRDLSGMALEVRAASGGEVLLSGVVPEL